MLNTGPDIYAGLRQVDLDAWLESYNRERPLSGRYCYRKTIWETFQQSKHLAVAKDLN